MSEALPVKIERIKKRPDFLLAAKAPALSRGAVFMQMRARLDDDPLIRVGFTATKKVGGSVERNRAKRRLREAARLLLPLHGRPMYDYVFIARGGTRTREWGRLLDDVKTALISLAAEHDRAEARARLAQSVDLPKDPSSDALPATPGAPDSSVSG
ncbi:MAG: ribonuclease P protein component [Caulobacter sp. 12-67-6]|nr:MAG: ribonuclease P protein component [Caulobacter sp. 12-67-6]OYX70151.1 MAG: ribonuclease P protein component [Caulobacter sp. 32-67-35]OYX91163.1 MAG: ribonuclease P protein component [Caulobacter sp. 35-67-4]